MSKCKCTMAISVNGDGCRYCQPQTYIDRLIETLEDEREEREAEMKESINGIQTDLLARCYELIENGGTLSGVAGRFSLNKERLSKAICLAKRDGLY